MPSKLILSIGFLLLTFGVTAEVSAELFWGFFNHLARETKRRQCWPEPFTAPDRAAVRTPFCTMVNNGWRRQNMLCAYHFDQETGKLNEAGRNKVRWILNVCPEQHRLIYVHLGENKTETLSRRASVEQLVAQMSPNDLPPVLTTSISEEGWSAAQADVIERKYISSMPDPRIPKATGSDTGSDTSGSF